VPDEAASFSRPGTLENLPAFIDFVGEACRRAGADPSSCLALRLAVEEVCVNLMRHGYAGREPGPIEMDVRAEPRRLVVTITDFAPPFFPESAPAPDLSSGWKERPLGGLGWHLVKTAVDQVRYESGASTGNRLTLVKNIEPKHKEEPHGNHGPRIGLGDDRRDPRKH
jgi:anti-sigma regulatory factor (Ser/Thr protein kinase)